MTDLGMSETLPAQSEDQTPARQGHSNLGFRKPVNLAEVERLASLGMPKSYMAPLLGISHDTLTARLKDGTVSEFAAAYESGLHAHRVAVLESLNKGMEKSFIPAIFLAKQPHILGFQDVQRQEVGGEVKIVVEQRILHETGKQISKIKADAEDV